MLFAIAEGFEESGGATRAAGFVLEGFEAKGS